jgi:hypothetical protein
MTMATAFRQNSGADRYPDLGRLSWAHFSGRPIRPLRAKVR